MKPYPPEFKVTPEEGGGYRIEENLGSGKFYPWNELFPTSGAANRRLVAFLSRTATVESTPTRRAAVRESGRPVAVPKAATKR